MRLWIFSASQIFFAKVCFSLSDADRLYALKSASTSRWSPLRRTIALLRSLSPVARLICRTPGGFFARAIRLVFIGFLLKQPREEMQHACHSRKNRPLRRR